MSDSLSSSACPAREFDVALMDLDGVVYVGPHAIDHAPQAISDARDLGMRMGYVTNNASRTPAEVAAHLVELGVAADAGDVVTSSQAGAHVIAERFAPGDAVLAVGGPGVDAALAEFGLRPVRSLDEQPRAVMQGFGRDVGWRDLAAASLAVRSGAFWVATNLDRTLPVPGGTAPGNGMLVAAVAEAAGRGPDVVAGKPHPPLMRESVERLSAQRPLVVGDRLDTDIEGAHVLGLASLLVLTGVTDPALLLAAPAQHRPSLIAPDLRGLLAAHGAPAVVAADRWVLGGAEARIDGAVLQVTVGPGDEGWIDALRCACCAAWSRPGLSTEAALRTLGC